MANGKITYTSQEQNYEEILLQAVAVIDNARTALAKQVTTIATSTYWGIGKLLYDRKLESKHGSSIVKQLSADLKQKYPNMGLSTRNLWYMKSFYERYKDCDEKVQRSVAVLPWSSNMLIISKNLTDEQTIFYAQETIRKGWNRDLLLNAIKMKMHEKALTVVDNNFAETLPTTIFHSLIAWRNYLTRTQALALYSVRRKTMYKWNLPLRTWVSLLGWLTTS